MIVVSPLQRIPATTIVIQPGGARNQELSARFVCIIEALDEVSPPFVLMDLIKDNKPLPAWKGSLEEHFPGNRIVPIQVSGMGFAPAGQQAQGQGSLADLPGPAQENHFLAKIFGY